MNPTVNAIPDKLTRALIGYREITARVTASSGRPASPIFPLQLLGHSTETMDRGSATY
jgi:hypothetical protein